MKTRDRIFFTLIGIFVTAKVYADGAPAINCVGLPGCTDTDIKNPLPAKVPRNIAGDYIVSATNYFIDIVAVAAVFALIISGIFYIVSGGNEEKTSRAKKWILWSLGGVFIAGISWGIVKFLNNVTI